MLRKVARERRLTSVEQLDFTPQGPVNPSPDDWRDQVIYQLLIDRFDDGKNHPPYNPKRAKRGRDPNQGQRFQGGTIRGITRRLDYIQGLGCTTLWISPPLKNRQHDEASYHGYGAQDFLSVDPRFGTLADFQKLVRDAHRRGMYVIMDIVVDHAGDVWAYPDDKEIIYARGKRFDFGFWRDGKVWPKELQDPDAFKRAGRMRDVAKSDGDEATDGDFESLKVLDLSNPRVLDAIIKIYKYWIAATDVDGFRIDALRHVRPEPAADFCHAIREYATRIGKKNFMMVGEVPGADRMIKYVGNNTPLNGEGKQATYPLLDAVLDFALAKMLGKILCGAQSSKPLRDRYQMLHDFYRDYGRVGRYLVTFLENHDMGAGNRRRLLHNEPDPRLSVLGAGYLLTNLGIPCLYYGMEQGFDGGGEEDWYVRECMFGGKWGAFDTTGMHFFNPKHPTYRAIAAINKIRAQTPALRYGRQYFREISGDGEHFGQPTGTKYTLAFSRVLDTQEVLIAMNLDREPRSDCITVDGALSPPKSTMTDLFGTTKDVRVEQTKDGRAFVRVNLPGRSMAILTKPT
jgi:glycosidase